MKVLVIISVSEPETAWNAFRYAGFAAKMGSEVNVFLISRGVETEHIENETFNVVEEIHNFLDAGGQITVCGTCLAKRKWDMARFGKVGTLAKLHEMITQNDRIINF